MTIHIVTGPPCAGKSTWARKQLHEGDVIVDYDQLAKTLGSNGHHDHPLTVGQVAAAARNAAIGRVFRGIEAEAWVLASFLTQKKVDEYEERGCQFHLIDPGLDECLRRADEDNRPEGTKDRIRKWYETRPQLPDATITHEGEKAMTNKDIRTKSFTVDALVESEGEGIFEGYASVFNNVDSYGDMVLPGAFAESLKAFPGGAGIPCYWSHRTDDPMFNIGVTLEAFEDARGLKVKVKLDLDTERGKHVYRLLKEGRVREMSFMYTVISGAWVEKHDPETGRYREYYELRELEIHEVSVVPVGANRETEILTVKSPGKSSGDFSCPCDCGQSKSGAEKSCEEPKMLNAEEPELANAEEAAEVKRGNPESVIREIAVMEMAAHS